MRYFFHLGYLGSNYSGWQRHSSGIGVQQVLEEALMKVLKTKLWIVGCGRTDAQVNASQFYFHLDTTQSWDFDLLFRLNKLLPDDIALFDIIPMHDEAHARFGAIERTYDYFIHAYKDPFLSRLSSFYFIKDWNLSQMQRAASLLIKYDNYSAFCKTPQKNNNNICNVTAASLFVDSTGDKLRFNISANRFLGKMVRIVIGKLIEVGSAVISIDEFEYHLINPQVPQSIKPVYPQGLYLSKVTYPYLDIAPRGNFAQVLSGETNNWTKI